MASSEQDVAVAANRLRGIIQIPGGTKMFNPFFTTKPAGEGTGLGLSMTHDIIVVQHGGRIDVATEPGQFTEFMSSCRGEQFFRQGSR